MNNDLLYQIALTLVPNVGCVQAKILIDTYGDAASIFKAKKKELSALENIGLISAANIKSFEDFSLAEDEIKFIEKYKIRPLFITDKNYPQRLLNCYDSPTLLYYRGNANLNASRIINIIGTRNNTDYGRQATEKLVNDLTAMNILIVSGLAFGIDSIAHKAALQNKLETIAVLAHGLQTIYPRHHKPLAKEIIEQGGLLTEFRHNEKPDKYNFPKRNRIVAGMADATIVMETALKGGSMITAELANNYNRDVFALPGRITDIKSAGCNYLIQSNKAALFTDAKDLMEILGWQPKKISKKLQAELFIELSEEEKVIVDLLKQKDSMHIDELNIRSNLSSSSIAAAILNLELQNVITSLPGKMYKVQ
ncbi:DNA-processing protein DprA [Parafilimonas sp.]|uniref:DNA-processing protein DprA n=1 Tax=Parafilimonas sp. TaxID=1969739 RepID=UPI0039E3FE41